MRAEIHQAFLSEFYLLATELLLEKCSSKSKIVAEFNLGESNPCNLMAQQETKCQILKST